MSVRAQQARACLINRYRFNRIRSELSMPIDRRRLNRALKRQVEKGFITEEPVLARWLPQLGVALRLSLAASLLPAPNPCPPQHPCTHMVREQWAQGIDCTCCPINMLAPCARSLTYTSRLLKLLSLDAIYDSCSWATKATSEVARLRARRARATINQQGGASGWRSHFERRWYRRCSIG